MILGSSFSKSIKEASRFCDEIQLLRTLVTADSLNTSHEFKEKTMRQDVSYNEVFITGLDNTDYNFILIDRSYFQFSINIKGRKDFDCRYAYYPNPFLDYEVEETEEIERKEASEFKQKIHFPPPIRYDIAFDAYRELRHSVCHFHVGLHQNRLPVDGYLSPLLFVIFISKTFYSDVWVSFDGNMTKGKVERKVLDEKYVEELQNSKQMKLDVKFSKEDRQQLYITGDCPPMKKLKKISKK